MSIRFFFITLFLPLIAFAQKDIPKDQDWIRKTYYKREVMIPMRDGVKLYTAIYVPRDSSESYPILMQRTPYSCAPYGEDKYRSKLGPNALLMEGKYIFVYQDARGRYKSEGVFREMTPALREKKTNQDVDESSDTYDTIEWLLHHTKNNGKAGLYGISFPGFYASAALPDAHPALKAVSPQAPMSDEFIGDDCYHNGAFFLMDNFGFYNGFDGPKSSNGESYGRHFQAEFKDAYQYFLDLGSLKKTTSAPFFSDSASIWRQITAHHVYDEFWKQRNIKKHLNNIRPAVLIVGGWFDAEDLYGALQTYRAIDKQSPDSHAWLVMGPWTHGGWAAPSWRSFSSYQFNQDVNPFYQKEIETRFFNFHLKGIGDFDLPKATVFETGTNQWKRYEAWPPAESTLTPYYFHESGVLSLNKPVERNAFSRYVSDPGNPVPYTSQKGARRNNEYMAEDQRFAASRPDVLVFQTDSLSSDLTLTGDLSANLHVSMTGSDADFIVKLIDVQPDGFQQMVRAEVLRGKFRNSFSIPEPFEKGKVSNVTVRLNEVAHCFKKGHRLMVQVQSSWFPLVDRNPQKFVNIFEAEDADFQKSEITVYHQQRNSSHIVLPVVK